MERGEAQREWRRGWSVPLVGMFGLSGATIVIYSGGVFAPLFASEFGWGRAQFFGGILIITLASMISLPLVGRIVDRLGPRTVGLIGIPTFAGVIALFGAMRGALWEYFGLCVLYAFAGAMVSHPVWTTAVASWFRASRGLAFAVTLSSIGLAASLWPVLATVYEGLLGWRLSYGAMALTWAIVVMPAAFVFLRPGPIAKDTDVNGAALTGASYRQAVLSLPFAGLAVAGALFALMLMPVTVFFIPILREKGLDAGQAAGIAAVIGICAIVGRILVGHLLDRLPARLIGVVVFALPAGAIAMLLGGGGSPPVAIAAAILIGFSMGAEMDIVTYLVARYFGLRNFAGLYGVVVALFGVAAGFGPLIGGLMYDASGSYSTFLMLMAPAVLIAAVLIALLPRPPEPATNQTA